MKYSNPLVSAVFALGFVLAPVPAGATELMPNFANVPTGWSVDRYAPDSFANIGTAFGRNNVLGIGINNTDGASSRPSGQQGTFYNTQGMSHALSGGAGDSLSASLYIPSLWADPTQGARRTDMWGVLLDSLSNIVDYPIIGFTNNNLVDSFVGFRAWNDQGSGGWVNLSNAVNYDGWNTLSILFSSSSPSNNSFNYYVNGTPAITLTADSVVVSFSRVIMQAYNFNDPSFTANNQVVANDYTAYWSNTPVPVPESSTLLLFVIGLAGLGFMRWRNKGAGSLPI